MSKNIIDASYITFFNSLKHRVEASRYRAVLKVNQEVILLYHHIGTQILQSQAEHGWGAKVIDQLSKDLKSAFPEMKGFSSTNLKYMKLFAENFTHEEISQQAADQLPWFHLVTILVACKEKPARSFYMDKAIAHGWSRQRLVAQIESNLYSREGKAITNFNNQLSSPLSDLANNTLKDPYLFDFLGLGKDAHEREVEKALIQHMEKFLLELGVGFAFVGRQYHLEISKRDYYIDLLFYHLKLRCFVVIELKDKEFKPEYTGKLNFYLSAVDDLLRHPSDNPSIGVILCKTKDNATAEYALRDINKPIGLAEYKLTDTLPDEVKTSLPTIEELEHELTKNLKAE
ncbi:PDDEXK nuclease domain-containing protein [Legionella sp.]|uniref:PDDEXK nuclease domain-containing protein n=1 Tax=Legionella sp. TaxID=459 RepID=UPI003C9604B8